MEIFFLDLTASIMDKDTGVTKRQGGLTVSFDSKDEMWDMYRLMVEPTYPKTVEAEQQLP